MAYSYDYNQVYGRNLEFKFAEYEVTCRYIKIDINSRSFYAYGAVVLKKNGEILRGDEFLFNPEEKKGSLIVFKRNIEIVSIGTEEGTPAIQKNDALDRITLLEIKKSLIYWTAPIIEIDKNFKVSGYEVTMYFEGIESLAFKKFKLIEGLKLKKGGFALDKIWYTRNQGVIARASYLYEKKNKFNSLTRFHYEERSVLKNYQGPQRQVDLMHSTSVSLNPSTNLGLTGNYNSSGLWNTNLWINRKWSERITTNFDFSFNKPINYKGEAWLGLQSTINAGNFGNISVIGRYEYQKQVIGNVSYSNTLFKKVNFLLTSTYSKVKISSIKEFSEIFSGNISLSYGSKIFNLSTDYYLNYDLIGSQLISQPQLRLSLNPVTFYGGLLSVYINNIFIYNNLRRNEKNEYSYSNNTIFSLSTSRIHIQKSLNLNFSISLEQFLEKEKRNFTSGGFIVNVEKEFFKGFFLEGYYSIQSRRRTKGWLIEGTTSQDLSTILRVSSLSWLDGGVSFSYDPKNKKWRQSFAYASVRFFRNWRFQSLLNYDFLLNKVNNVDLYLIREAGRFQLRFVWRSLSKQFLVELVPQ
ncbi:MAG: hypothetical protein KAU91_06345 [Candidatus Aminicenantes bacterium]|nr:hypothetical protein [Candidatus Aminicenantes bacterium]